MAHHKKYYKDLESNGHLWTLEIWQESELEFEPIEIGPVLQSLKIDVLGNQADIDTPIVKTSLEMSFIDAPDFEQGRKCGFWEEFYTSAATEYLILLRKDGRPEWTGYITPDSFEEDLRYRGSVSIIARDNLGYMQDFPFSMHTSDGRVTIAQILSEAVNVVGFKMNIVHAHQFPKFSEDNKDLRDVMFNISAFRDKTWWDVLESVLYSLGLTLRYVGQNNFLLSCIREQSKCGYPDYDSMPKKNVQFINYGHRELVPSVKAIMETTEFDILESIVDIYAPEGQYGEKGSLAFVEMDNGIKIDEYAMPVNEYASQSAGVASASVGTSRLLNPFTHKLRSKGIDKSQKSIHTDDVLLALCNTIDITSYENEQTGNITYDYSFRETNPLVFSSKIQLACTLEMAFTFERPVVLYADGTIGDFLESEFGSQLYLNSVGFKGYWVGADGTRKYFYHPTLQGGWSATDPGFVVTVPSGADKFFKEPVTISLPALTVEGPGELTLEFYGAYFDNTANRNNTGSQGAYIRITDVHIMASSETSVILAEKTKVTTAYNQQNNLLLKREPQYVPNPNLPLAPQMVVNNIMVQENGLFVGPLDWTWEDDQEDMQLTALIHKQILSYYANPMNLLSGELFDADNDATFDALYLWNGKEHSLTSGTLNILTGRIESAVLRQFIRYEYIWGKGEPYIVVENPDIHLEYTPYAPTFIVRTNKTLTYESWGGDIPYWIAPRDPIYNAGNDTWECKVTVYPNTTGEVRVANFKIDTADVRITQGYNANQ